MTEKTKLYQLICLFSPLSGQEECDKAAKDTEKWITDQAGSIRQSSKIERKALSYPIKKYLEAYYWIVDFSLPPESVQQLSQNLKMRSDVIRTLLVAEDAVKKAKPAAKPQAVEPLSNPFVAKVEPIDAAQPSVTPTAAPKPQNTVQQPAVPTVAPAPAEAAKKEEKPLTAAIKEAPTKAAPVPEPKKTSEPQKTARNEKAQIEDLDKKLEEILNQ